MEVFLNPSTAGAQHAFTSAAIGNASAVLNDWGQRATEAWSSVSRHLWGPGSTDFLNQPSSAGVPPDFIRSLSNNGEANSEKRTNKEDNNPAHVRQPGVKDTSSLTETPEAKRRRTIESAHVQLYGPTGEHLDTDTLFNDFHGRVSSDYSHLANFSDRIQFNVYPYLGNGPTELHFNAAKMGMLDSKVRDDKLLDVKMGRIPSPFHLKESLARAEYLAPIIFKLPNVFTPMSPSTALFTPGPPASAGNFVQALVGFSKYKNMTVTDLLNLAEAAFKKSNDNVPILAHGQEIGVISGMTFFELFREYLDSKTSRLTDVEDGALKELHIPRKYLDLKKFNFAAVGL